MKLKLKKIDKYNFFHMLFTLYQRLQAKSMANGKTIKVRAYHYFNFNSAGQIHEIGDFFDASGVMNAAMASSEK